MAFINTTDVIGQVIMYSVINITGSLFLSLLCVVMGLIALSLAFRMPIELTIPVITPLLIAIMAYTADFMTVGGVALIYIAVLMFKWFFIR